MKKLLLLFLIPLLLFLAACQKKTETSLNPSSPEGLKASVKSDVSLTILDSNTQK